MVGPPRRPRRKMTGASWMALALVVLGVVLGALDGLILLIAIAFGPSGFGGDHTQTAGQIARSHRGQLAGFVALALSAATVPVASNSTLRALRSAMQRTPRSADWCRKLIESI